MKKNLLRGIITAAGAIIFAQNLAAQNKLESLLSEAKSVLGCTDFDKPETLYSLNAPFIANEKVERYTCSADKKFVDVLTTFIPEESASIERYGWMEIVGNSSKPTHQILIEVSKPHLLPIVIMETTEVPGYVNNVSGTAITLADNSTVALNSFNISTNMRFTDWNLFSIGDFDSWEYCPMHFDEETSSFAVFKPGNDSSVIGGNPDLCNSSYDLSQADINLSPVSQWLVSVKTPKAKISIDYSYLQVALPNLRLSDIANLQKAILIKGL